MTANIDDDPEGSPMNQRLIVPVDGSAASWAAVDVAISLARKTSATVHVVEVVFAPDDRGAANDRLTTGLGGVDVTGVAVESEARLGADSVAAAIDELITIHPSAVVVMASHGRGRSAGLVGSVAEDVLHRVFGPILLVGPAAIATDFVGPLVVSVDGSQESEAALPLAAAWAIELGITPWIVHVADPKDAPPAAAHIVESAYPARLAHDLAAVSRHEVEFEELHDRHPAKAVPDFADRMDASLIVATSHGRTGLSRVTMGSVTAGFVRHATCPVLVIRLPLPAHDSTKVGVSTLAPT